LEGTRVEDVVQVAAAEVGRLPLSAVSDALLRRLHLCHAGWTREQLEAVIRLICRAALALALAKQDKQYPRYLIVHNIHSSYQKEEMIEKLFTIGILPPIQRRLEGSAGERM